VTSGYSDYIVYVDESGDHGMRNIEPTFPVFVLACCVFKTNAYINRLVPALHGFKFRHFGHDGVILHERDIRKDIGAFAFLKNRDSKEAFLEELTEIVGAMPFRVVAAVVDKRRLWERHGDGHNPYHLSLKFCLERLFTLLGEEGQLERTTHITFEARGGKEDRELELEFRRVCAGDNHFRVSMPFEIVIAEKKVNCAGLQLADLIARPIGMSMLRPDQANRAMEVIQSKFYRSAQEQVDGWALKCLP
jgi:hypothetical protein